MRYSDSGSFVLIKYNVYMALTLESMRILLGTIKVVVKLVLLGSGLLQILIIGIYNDFKDDSDNFAKYQV